MRKPYMQAGQCIETDIKVLVIRDRRTIQNASYQVS